MPLPQRVGFQTQVLLPVMSIMVLLVIVPMRMVNLQMSEQLEEAAAENLQKSDAVFASFLAIRYKGLLDKFGTIPNEPRSKAVFQLADPKTTEVLLHDLVEETGADIAFLVDANLKPVALTQKLAGTHAGNLPLVARDLLTLALSGQPSAQTVSAGGALYDVVCLGVKSGLDGVGALAFATRLDNASAREFGRVTHSEIALLAGAKVVANTLNSPDPDGALSVPAGQLATRAVHSSVRPGARPATISINGEHYMYVARRLGGANASDGIGYILLSSYERSLQSLRAIEKSFFWVQLAGVGLGGALIWFLVRLATRPLMLLRDTAEAVGRGDFSRRVELHSRDEIGELAAVFNQMTRNLEASRKELEMTVETLKSTQSQLIQSEKMRAIGTLAGGIAHDFNNILGAILGFSELVLEDVPAESRIARNTNQVLKAGRRARDLVRQILVFSRQSDPQRTKVQVGAILDEILHLLRATIPTTIELRRVVTTQSDVVVADSTQLHQVLMNLGTNASHAMKDHGGTLTFSLEDFSVSQKGAGPAPSLPVGDYIRLGVADTGHGMSKEVIQRIFEPFFTTKPVGEGTGLGLAVVHGIVKNHGGEITVESEPGKGTTFYIYLPRVVFAEDHARGEATCLKGDGLKLLVVDDEEALLSVLQQKLARLGYQVTLSGDGHDALKVFTGSPDAFDVVITDQMMPRLTGLEFAARLRQIRPATPVILCTGSAGGGANPNPLPEGIDAYVPKPVDFVQLTRSIHLTLGAVRKDRSSN